MTKAICFEKVRNKQGRITHYKLRNDNQTMIVTAKELKEAIDGKHIYVSNLQLTSNGRLVDKHTESNIDKESRQNNIEKAAAKAIVFLDNELIDMGDCYEESVSNWCCQAGIEFDSSNCDTKYINSKAVEAITILLGKNINSMLKSYTDYYFEYVSIFRYNLVRYKDTDIRKNPIIKAFDCLISCVHRKVKQGIADNKYYTKLVNIRNGIAYIDLQACVIGRNIGGEFFKYLDRNTCFNITSNDSFTVGRVLDVYEPEYKLGAYTIHAELNATGLPRNEGYLVAFKTLQDKKVVRGHIYEYSNKSKENETYKSTNKVIDIPFDVNIVKVSRTVANMINRLAIFKYMHLLNK